MSAFNTVSVPAGETCPACGTEIRRRVQFKYGSRRAYEYVVGDELRWGANDTGERVHLVTVLGFPEPCPHCGDDPGGVYDVIIRDNVIEAVVPGRTQPYIDDGDRGYIVVER